MSLLSSAELIAIVLDSFEAERTNDTARGKRLIADNFSKVSMMIYGDVLFPRLEGVDAVHNALLQAYSVKGREFHVWNTAANETTQTVFVELAETEPSSDRVNIWPYTLVCEISEGRITRTRHYGDPQLLKRDISLDEIKKAITQ